MLNEVYKNKIQVKEARLLLKTKLIETIKILNRTKIFIMFFFSS